MNEKTRRCECPENGSATDKGLYKREEYIAMRHKPNKCKGTYQLRKYKRDNKILWLCSACNIGGDIEIR